MQWVHVTHLDTNNAAGFSKIRLDHLLRRTYHIIWYLSLLVQLFLEAGGFFSFIRLTCLEICRVKLWPTNPLLLYSPFNHFLFFFSFFFSFSISSSLFSYFSFFFFSLFFFFLFFFSFYLVLVFFVFSFSVFSNFFFTSLFSFFFFPCSAFFFIFVIFIFCFVFLIYPPLALSFLGSLFERSRDLYLDPPKPGRGQSRSERSYSKFPKENQRAITDRGGMLFENFYRQKARKPQKRFQTHTARKKNRKPTKSHQN